MRVEEDEEYKLTEEECHYRSKLNAFHLLQDIKNVRNELMILEFLLNQQSKVWTRLVSSISEEKKAGEPHDVKNESKEFDKSGDCDQLIQDIEEMDNAAERVQESVTQ